MLKKAMDWARRHLILFGTAKFIAGLVIGFGLGVYFLPILTAEKGLDETQLAALQENVQRQGVFVKDLPGSDAFHWGEGTVYASDERIWLDGEIAPGPDYRLYLTPSYVDTKEDFLKIKDQSVQVAPIKAFRNFSVEVPDGVEVGDYPALLIWCEAFSMFITSAEPR